MANAQKQIAITKLFPVIFINIFFYYRNKLSQFDVVGYVKINKR